MEEKRLTVNEIREAAEKAWKKGELTENERRIISDLIATVFNNERR